MKKTFLYNLKANPPLFARFQGIQSILMAAHAASTSIPHNVAGAEREIFFREFLSIVFPPPFRFTTGAIVDPSGKLSGQLDVVIERPYAPSLPLPLSGQRLFLTDNVAAVLEIKSDLNAQYSGVRSTTEKVHSLGYQPIHTGTVAGIMPKRIPVFAVAYKGHKTPQGLQKSVLATPEHERPEGALIIESGCFFHCSPYGEYLGCGPTGIFAFICTISTILTSVQSNSPNLMRFAQIESEADILKDATNPSQ